MTNLDPYMEYLDVDPIEVSLVDRGANRRKIQVMKTEDAGPTLVVCDVCKMESAPAETAWTFTAEDLSSLGGHAREAHLVYDPDKADVLKFPVAKMLDGKLTLNLQALKSAALELSKVSDLDENVRADAYLLATQYMTATFGMKPEELPAFEKNEAKKDYTTSTAGLKFAVRIDIRPDIVGGRFVIFDETTWSDGSVDRTIRDMAPTTWMCGLEYNPDPNYNYNTGEMLVSKALFAKTLADLQAGKLSKEDARKQLENAYSMITATSTAIVQTAKKAGLDFLTEEAVAKSDRKMTARRRDVLRSASESIIGLLTELEVEMAGEETKTGEQAVVDASKTEGAAAGEKKEEAAAAVAAPDQAVMIEQAVAKALAPLAEKLTALEAQVAKIPAEKKDEKIVVSEEVSKSLKTMADRLDALEANPSNGGDSTVKVKAEKSEDSLWTGFIK